MSEQTLNLIKESEARWVDLRFSDTRGKEQHVSIPSSEVDADFFEGGKMFDGSSISGWKGINESDMILMPDDDTSVLDPFTDEATVILRCDIVEPMTMQGYDRDPRSVAHRTGRGCRSRLLLRPRLCCHRSPGGSPRRPPINRVCRTLPRHRHRHGPRAPHLNSVRTHRTRMGT